MEDFFEILIWLFIIISFLSGLFKRKNKQPLPPPVKKQRPDIQVNRGASTTYSQTNERYDILREIEGLFKPQGPSQIPSGETASMERAGEISSTSSEHISNEGIRRESEYTSYETAKSKAKREKELSYRTKTEHDVTSSEHVYSTYQREKKVVDSKIAEQALRFEKMLAQKKKENQFLQEIRKKINHPESLREYILFSEILGKPKALRR